METPLSNGLKMTSEECVTLNKDQFRQLIEVLISIREGIVDVENEIISIKEEVSVLKEKGINFEIKSL